MKTKILKLLLFVSMMMLISQIPANAATYGDFTYTSNGSYITVTDFSATATTCTIPEKINNLPVRKISANAFKDCTALTRITIPGSVESIGENTFLNCTALDRVYIVNLTAYLNTDYGNAYSCPMYYADKLYLNNSRVIDVTVPQGAVKIPDYAFDGCDSLETIMLSDSVTSIGKNAFNGCISLSDTDIPDSVTYVGENAFSGCIMIKTMVIPDSVKTIGFSAFQGCTNMNSLTIPFISGSAVENRYFGYVFGSNSYNDNNSYVPSSLKKVVITGGEKIYDYAFYDCESIISIEIPGTVQSIGFGAFRYCSSLESITLPFVGNIASDSQCFGYVFGTSSYNSNANYIPKSLENVTILGGEIGDYAFYGSYITDVTLCSGITRMGSHIFENCKSLTDLVIKNGPQILEGRQFYNCTSLKNITIPESITEIEAYTFYNCSKISTVNYGGSDADWEDVYIGNYNGNIKSAQMNYIQNSLYKFTYDANGGTNVPSYPAVETGDRIIVSFEVPLRDSYRFLGWSETASATVPAYVGGDEIIMGEADMTLYAVWVKMSTLSYNANGGLYPPDAEIYETGYIAVISDEIPTRNGYKFFGWAEKSGATTSKYQPGEEIVIGDENITLYAVWKKIVKFSYNGNGGTNVPSGATVLQGDVVTVSSVIPRRSEYEFKGWSTSPNKYFPDYVAGDKIKINTSDITLYAVWRKICSVGAEIMNEVILVTPEGVPDDSVIICAFYNQGKFVFADDYVYTGSAMVPFGYVGKYDEIKVMVFMDMHGLMPMCDAVSVYAEQPVSLMMID